MPSTHAIDHDQRDEQQVMPRDAAVREAERLEHRDLRALEKHEPRDHDVDEERRDREEDRRNA